jgi:hypothetical protein
VTKFLQSYFSEEQQTEKLRQDIIRQSRVLNFRSKAIINSSPFSTKQVKKLYTLPIRGGDIETANKLKLLPAIAEKIKKFLGWLCIFLKIKKIENRHNLILQLFRLNLKFVLRFWDVSIITFIFDLTIVDPTPVPIIMGIAVGSNVGYLGVGGTLIAQSLLATFML